MEKELCRHIYKNGESAIYFNRASERPWYNYKCKLCNKRFAMPPEINASLDDEYKGSKFTIEEKDEYTIKELCRILLVPDGKIKKAIKDGSIKAYMKKGYGCRKCWFIPKKELEKFLSLSSNFKLQEMYNMYFVIKKDEEEAESFRIKRRFLVIDNLKGGDY